MGEPLWPLEPSAFDTLLLIYLRLHQPNVSAELRGVGFMQSVLGMGMPCARCACCAIPGRISSTLILQGFLDLSVAADNQVCNESPHRQPLCSSGP